MENHGKPPEAWTNGSVGNTEKAARNGRAGTSGMDAQISGGLSKSANGPSGGNWASLRMGESEKPKPPRRAGACISAASGMEWLQFPC